ncbi:energy transducer TonB [Roseomonas sp. KE2513]|uniref:energy transducer TonB n=1 Tax=Roseomonas sp. KE2513 TaxID=2479202 RepID=UPI0018DFB068|nr:energy transducer TonB [Roseomonas sp. KE2513]
MGAPLGRPRRSVRRAAMRRGWRGPALALSLLLHLAAGWWLLFGLPPRKMPEATSPSAVDVVFEGGAPEDVPAPPSEGPPAPLEPPTPGALPAPPSPPAAPPMPQVAEPAPPAEAPAAPPMPRVAEAPPLPAPFAPPSFLPPAAPSLPAPPSAAPPVPPPLAQGPAAPPPPAPPLAEPPVARALPLPPLASQPAPSEFSVPPPPPPAETPRESEVAALPLPPPPAPEPPSAPPEPAQARPSPVPAPRPPQVAQPQPARPRSSPPANSPFAGALDLSQGPPITLSRPSAPSAPGGAGLRRDREAAAPNLTANADAPNAQLRIRGANLGADWRSAFMAWLREHGYYPRQAAEAGEDGTAVVRFTVDRTGRVSGLQLIGRSGSIWLDAGAQALLRGRSVPPFPASTREDSAEIDLTINYILRRR